MCTGLIQPLVSFSSGQDNLKNEKALLPNFRDLVGCGTNEKKLRRINVDAVASTSSSN